MLKVTRLIRHKRALRLMLVLLLGVKLFKYITFFKYYSHTQISNLNTYTQINCLTLKFEGYDVFAQSHIHVTSLETRIHAIRVS